MEAELKKVIVLLVQLANAREGNIPSTQLAQLRNAAQEALSGVESVTGKLTLPSH